MAGLVGACEALLAVLGGFEPGGLDGEACATVVRELALVEKRCAVVRARTARRAAALGQHRREGAADVGSWMSKATGTSARAARREVETVAALEDCPDTAAAVDAGEVSLGQASVITRAAVTVPGSEQELLAVARSAGGMAALRERDRELRTRSVSAEDLRAKQRKARGFRHWRDELGMIRYSGAMLPETGVPFVNRLDAEAARIRKAARRAGSDEPWDAHAADAFAGIVGGQSRGKGGGTDLTLVIDTRAWRRGHAHEGEPCHIIGGGPVPVGLAQEMFDDAFVKAVIHDGVKIDTVAHFGRYKKAELRTALNLGPAPDFAGVTCNEPGCDRRYGLQWDHLDPVANGGPTSLDNLDPKCTPHHWEKTEKDRKAGLLRRRRPPPKAA